MNMVNDDDIENAMNNHHGDALVEQLVKLALDAGGKDNITIVLCENM